MSKVFTVQNWKDRGQGSLRDAIAQAQSGDTIKFDSSLANKTIKLTSGQLEVDKDLIIDGGNAPGLTISGNNASRVFFIQGDPPWEPVEVTLKNLTIADGKTTGTGENASGAGIWTHGNTTLKVEDSKFKNNHANGGGGGGIFAGWRSTNTVINSIFENNSASGTDGRGGGAIAVKSESSTIVQDSEFTKNKGVNGGAINTLLGGLTVENSTFTQNTSTDAGGAILTDGASATSNSSTKGTIEISNSRFDGNQGAGQGGALFLYVYDGDKVIIEDSTIINNQVIADAKGNSLGGGLRHGKGELIIQNTTFAYNRAFQQGGAAWVGENAPVEIDNSIFYGNRAESADGKGGIGGALVLPSESNTRKISNTTVADNYAGFMGGGFANGGNNTQLKNTLFADNVAYNGGNSWNINHHTTQVFKDQGGNFQSEYPNPNDTKITAKVELVDPQLGDFTDNGGAVQTAPIVGNPEVTGGALLEPTTDIGNVNNEPELVTAISNQTVNVDEPLSFDISENFSDPDGDDLSFSATLKNGKPLPSWLNFNSETGIFSGTPSSGDKTKQTILVTANDGQGGIESDAFKLKLTTPPVQDTSPVQDTPPVQDDPILISEGEPELINLEDQTSSVSAKFFNIESDAGFDNSVGFYAVENEQGDVQDKVTGELISPDDAGYAQAALAQQVVGDLNRNTGIFEAEFQAGTILAPYIIANGTTEEWLETNPNNQRLAWNDPIAYFAYLGANPDGKDHVSLLGEKKFGFEDWYGGGDMDHNDITVEVDLTVA
ncbi:MAG: putative Ig domain-containing protein [Coleofasciculus sp. A1-SPW-01]|uniref:putative Ig domain-containing protein n=1 Tax=Coleofasciculus sp. A1-SPW-01 TaxID=3070819 RepID=UPI0032F38715